MSDELKQQFMSDLKDLNDENRKNLMILVAVLWAVSTALFGWIATDWSKRMNDGEIRDKQMTERQARLDTDVALLKSVDANHDRQLEVLTRATEGIQRSHSDLIQQMTEVRVSVTTIKELTRNTSERVEDITKFLRGGKEVIDGSAARQYRKDNP